MMQKNILTSQHWDFLMEYLSKIDASYFGLNEKTDVDSTQKVLGNLMALQEEVGEFTSEIRKFTKMMFNKKKIESFKIEDLEDEGCDILITLILVLKSCWISDLDAAIERKIAKNNSRGY